MLRPRTGPPSTAAILRAALWPIAIMSIIHRSYVLSTNGYITDDFGPVYRAVSNFRRGLDIYNEHFDYVDPHYLYPPGGTFVDGPSATCRCSPPTTGSSSSTPSQMIVAAVLLVRLFSFSLTFVALPALLLAMFCTESVTNTLVFTNINGCILLLEVLFLPMAARRPHQPAVVGRNRHRTRWWSSHSWAFCCFCHCSTDSGGLW